MYKNQMQELAQRSCFNLPLYFCIREDPDHAPRFKAVVTFNGETLESPKFYTTLRQVKHMAAEVALSTMSRRGPPQSLAAIISYMMKFLTEFEAKLGIRIQCSQEIEPLGTAGPLALDKDKLIDGSGQPVFVLNSDVIYEFPLKEMEEFHRSHGAEASVMVTRVDEPSKYVVVLDDETRRVKRFVEKPQMSVGNKINAGIYLLNPSVFDRIELKPTSIEKDIFPIIAEENQLYAMVLPGFWMETGQPRDYLSGLRLYLDYLRTKSDMLASAPKFQGNVLIDEIVQIGEGCLIGPDVSIGPGCLKSDMLASGPQFQGNVFIDESVEIGEGCVIGHDVSLGPVCIVDIGVRLSNCAIMRGVRIKKHACVSGSIVSWHSTVGQWARVETVIVVWCCPIKRSNLTFSSLRLSCESFHFSQ